MEEQENLSLNFNWCNKVLGHSGIHYKWLAKLESSVVGDLDIPRVSGIINIETCQFKRPLPFMCKAKNMPLYIHWGAITTIPLCVPSFLSPDMIPDHRDISHLNSIAMNNATMPSSQPATAPAPQ
jgi:hypothetical protein